MAQSEPGIKLRFCYGIYISPEIVTFQTQIGLLSVVSVIASFGFFTSAVQKLLILRLKKNSTIKFDELFFTTIIMLCTSRLYFILTEPVPNYIFSDICKGYGQFTEEKSDQINH
mmetsp:Transcript_39720/g.60884  ORF Transcript_39720/g.60884 Transcript_39720/m.60884 type:complete len:114 (+) Transcript_39720:2218-2559(+)